MFSLWDFRLGFRAGAVVVFIHWRVAAERRGKSEPLIDQAMKEWQTVGPAAQIMIDVISHHVDKGGSPAEAAAAMRAALDGSIKSVAPDHWIDRAMSCVTVFGGTGFLGRRVVQKLCESGATVRIASRHPGRAEGDNVKQIAADARNGAPLRPPLWAPIA